MVALFVPRRYLFAIVSLVVLVFAACGGGDGDAGGTDAPQDDGSPGATASLALNEYLVTTLQIDADLSRVTGDLSAELTNNQTDPQALADAAIELERKLSELAAAAVEELSAITPPAEAEDYHDSLLSAMEDLEELSARMADALEEGDPEEITEALADFTGSLSRLAEVAAQVQELLTTAFRADGENELETYLIDTLEARSGVQKALSDYATEAQQVIQSGDTEATAALLENLVVALEEFEAEFNELSPPSEANAVHQRQAELIALTISAERGLLNALRDEDPDALASASLKLIDIAVEGSYVTVEWDELMIVALQR